MSNLLTSLMVEPGTGAKLDGIDVDRWNTEPDLAVPPTGESQPQSMDRSQALNLYKRLIVEAGVRVSLARVDPGYNGWHRSYETALPEIQTCAARLDQLQYLMYAEKKHSLLIVLQGLDASGKDGVVRRLVSGINPAGCRLVAFKKPKSEDLDHDFLWRVHPHLPAKGEVVIFNRSHYEDVLVVRVHHFAQVNLWSKRYDLINDFERLLVTENNTTILKFFLYISKDEQLARFKQRLDDPLRRWKISEADYEERAYWNHYTAAFEDMLYRTSTRHAPWFVIPSNQKWFRDLAILQIVNRKLEDLDMKLPEPAVDINAIRRRYHAELEVA